MAQSREHIIDTADGQDDQVRTIFALERRKNGVFVWLEASFALPWS
jgi:hypothetical protein